MLPVATVVISYHRPQMVLSCLGKLLALPDAPARIWLVDNAPRDGTALLVREQFPSVEIINAGDNLGFAAGNNLGLQAALDEGYAFILLLNDDAELMPGSLARLYHAINADKSIGSIGPLVYFSDGKNIWSAGGLINHHEGTARHLLHPPSNSAFYAVDYVIACAVLYRSEALKSVGLFDERFFMYYEDSDLGVRLANAGYRNVIDNNAAALHHVPPHLGTRMKTANFLYYLNRNRILFMRKHNPLHNILSALLFRSLLELVIVLGKGNWTGFYWGIRGLADGIMGKSGGMAGWN